MRAERLERELLPRRIRLRAAHCAPARSLATYANRAFLKGLGLHWDPAGHRWHGTTSAENVRALCEHLGLEVRVFGSLNMASEIAPSGPTAPKPAGPCSGPIPVATRRSHDG